jgi:aspartate/methionine/tyrosine aminotransferase
LKGLDQNGIPHNVPQGAYFVLADIGQFLDLPRFYGFSDLDFCVWMAEHIGVAAVPGSSFLKEGDSRLIRLHFARSESSLNEALKRLGGLGAL